MAVIKSATDTRYSVSDVVSHDGDRMPCIALNSIHSLREQMGEELYDAVRPHWGAGNTKIILMMVFCGESWGSIWCFSWPDVWQMCVEVFGSCEEGGGYLETTDVVFELSCVSNKRIVEIRESSCSWFLGQMG